MTLRRRTRIIIHCARCFRENTRRIPLRSSLEICNTKMQEHLGFLEECAHFCAHSDRMEPHMMGIPSVPMSLLCAETEPVFTPLGRTVSTDRMSVEHAMRHEARLAVERFERIVKNHVNSSPA